MSKPKIGSKAPDFTAAVSGGDYESGAEVSLKELRGKPVVLYFYPKDDTPGCTKQACGLRDSWTKLAKKAHIFGVSIDSVKSHDKFIKKYELPFPLISDDEKKFVEAYGVWVEKSMYGKQYMGIERSHFVIDEHGKILDAQVKVKPEESVERAFAALG